MPSGEIASVDSFNLGHAELPGSESEQVATLTHPREIDMPTAPVI